MIETLVLDLEVCYLAGASGVLWNRSAASDGQADFWIMEPRCLLERSNKLLPTRPW